MLRIMKFLLCDAWACYPMIRYDLEWLDLEEEVLKLIFLENTHFQSIAMFNQSIALPRNVVFLLGRKLMSLGAIDCT